MQILKKLARIYVKDMDSAIHFYKELTHDSMGRRFEMPQFKIEVASVGDLLIICGEEEHLAPFKKTTATFFVDSLDDFKNFLESNGAEILTGPSQVPTGRNMTVQHPDGTIIEYVEHF